MAPRRGSGTSPFSNAAVILRWFGMITMKTLAAMMVPTTTPTWMKAPRPENRWVKT